MRKVISLVLVAVMLISVFAVLPTASAAETVYKAGTVLQIKWKFPNVDTFEGFQGEINYDTTVLEVDQSTANCPDNTGLGMDDIGVVMAISNVRTGYDISSDHTMFSANFTVKEDITDLGFETVVLIYNMNDDATLEMLDGTNEFEVTVLSAPTEPTEAPTEAPTEEPTEEPTEAPTEEPTDAPTDAPTEEPTDAPTDAPTEEPTDAPTEAVKNGIYAEDGALYYYKDGARYYAGLIMIDGYYYYVNSSCKVIAGRAYYVSKTNYLLPSASYTFDEEGKMVNPPVEETTESTEAGQVKNGIFEEDGALYYYKDGERNYAGLIKIGDYYYYVNSSCKVVAGVTYYISKTNTLLPAAAYKFGLDGKMLNPPTIEETDTPDDGSVKDGFVKENGSTYYYVDGVKTYAGVIKIDGYYYYVKSSCKVITGMAYYVSKTNGYVDAGTYYFDSEGRMLDENKNPIDANDNSQYIPV